MEALLRSDATPQLGRSNAGHQGLGAYPALTGIIKIFKSSHMALILTAVVTLLGRPCQTQRQINFSAQVLR